MTQYPIYKLYKRRVKEDFGLYPINALTSSGKTSAIANLYDDSSYDKITICISNNKKNTKLMYDTHKSSIKNFDKESLMLFSTKDHLIDRLTKESDYRKAFKTFLNDYDYVLKNSYDDSNLSYKIIKYMINLDEYKTFPNFKKLFANKGNEIKSSITIEKSIYSVKDDEESKEVLAYNNFKKLFRDSLRAIIKETYPNDKFIKANGLFKKVLSNDDTCWYYFYIIQELNLIKADIGVLKRIYLNIYKALYPLSLGYPMGTFNRFLDLPCLKGSVIFIDEVDDCYSKMMDILTENFATNALYDYLSDNLNLVFNVSIGHWYEELVDDSINKAYKKLFDYSWEILKKYQFKRLFKRNSRKSFIFHCKKGCSYTNFCNSKGCFIVL